VIARRLEQLKIDCIVVAPSRTPHRDRQRRWLRRLVGQIHRHHWGKMSVRSSGAAAFLENGLVQPASRCALRRSRTL